QGLELLQQRRGIVEEFWDVPPDSGFQLLRLDRPSGAALVAVAGPTVFAVALVVAVLGPIVGGALRNPEHRQAAAPAGQQAAEQVIVTAVIAKGADRIPCQLGQRLLVGWFVDAGRDRDRNPLFPRTRVAAGRFAGTGTTRARPPRHLERVPVSVGG